MAFLFYSFQQLFRPPSTAIDHGGLRTWSPAQLLAPFGFGLKLIHICALVAAATGLLSFAMYSASDLASSCLHLLASALSLSTNCVLVAAAVPFIWVSCHVLSGPAFG
jgi:hypothetical protein